MIRWVAKRLGPNTDYVRMHTPKLDFKPYKRGRYRPARNEILRDFQVSKWALSGVKIMDLALCSRGEFNFLIDKATGAILPELSQLEYLRLAKPFIAPCTTFMPALKHLDCGVYHNEATEVLRVAATMPNLESLLLDVSDAKHEMIRLARLELAGAPHLLHVLLRNIGCASLTVLLGCSLGFSAQRVAMVSWLHQAAALELSFVPFVKYLDLRVPSHLLQWRDVFPFFLQKYETIATLRIVAAPEDDHAFAAAWQRLANTMLISPVRLDNLKALIICGTDIDLQVPHSFHRLEELVVVATRSLILDFSNTETENSAQILSSTLKILHLEGLMAREPPRQDRPSNELQHNVLAIQTILSHYLARRGLTVERFVNVASFNTAGPIHTIMCVREDTAEALDFEHAHALGVSLVACRCKACKSCLRGKYGFRF